MAMANKNKESVLLVRVCYDPITRVEWMQVDLGTKKLKKSSVSIGAPPKTVFLEATCVASLGRQAIIFGGHEFSEGNRPTAQVHILDPAAKTWRQAANMGRGRGDAAYGVIDGKLYAAGGFAGSEVGWLDYTEVYDPKSDSWTELSTMPEAGLMIELFCVWKGKLWVYGSKFPVGTTDFRKRERLAWSFCPVNNVWKDEGWVVPMLEMATPMCYRKLAVGGETLYLAQADVHFRQDDYFCEIAVKKLDARSLKWVDHTVYLDMAESYNCECSTDADASRIHGLQDGVLVVDHLDDEERDFKVRKKKTELVRLSVTCPSNWVTAVISA